MRQCITGRWDVPFFAGIGQSIGTVVDNVAAAMPTAGGRLRIEPDQLDGAIAVFQEALDTLAGEVERARTELQAMPPANDDVSRDAANAFNRLGYVNENSAVMAWQGAVEQLESIVEQLKAAKEAIVRADTGNVSNFRVP
jgi:hypothetical protein